MLLGKWFAQPVSTRTLWKMLLTLETFVPQISRTGAVSTIEILAYLSQRSPVAGCSWVTNAESYLLFTSSVCQLPMTVVHFQETGRAPSEVMTTKTQRLTLGKDTKGQRIGAPFHDVLSEVWWQRSASVSRQQAGSSVLPEAAPLTAGQCLLLLLTWFPFLPLPLLLLLLLILVYLHRTFTSSISFNVNKTPLK